MTFEELHKILDDENKEISFKEFQEILFELRRDCLDEIYRSQTNNKLHYYNGEQNAFQIAIDLSEHLIAKNASMPKYKIGNKVSYFVGNTLYHTEIEHIKVHYKRNGNVKIQYVVVSPDGFKTHKNEIDLFQTKEQKEEAKGE